MFFRKKRLYGSLQGVLFMQREAGAEAIHLDDIGVAELAP